MQTPPPARRLVKSVVGQPGWDYLHDVKTGIRQAGARRAKREAEAEQREAARLRPQVLTDEQIIARAKKIEKDREAREMAERSKNLTELARYFRTDKWGDHHYTPHYQKHLEHLRDRPIKLLEIGIGGYSRVKQGGASLRMWKHFFPKAHIVGLDIQDKSFVVESRIAAYQGDQTDAELLTRMSEEAGPFDVIIDDGSHLPAHVIATFNVLFPLLAPDGIYVVEDTQTSYWPEWGGSEDLDDLGTSMAMLKRLTDGLNYVEFPDESYEPTYEDLNIISVSFYHNLVFIQKGPNAENTRRRQILKKRYADPS